MIDEKKHILSLCNSEPACLVNSENQYYNSDTISWGCPPMKTENEFGVLKNQAEEIEDNYFAYEQNVDMSILNNRIDMLTDRIDAEKNYLDKRANEIETTVKDGIYDDNILEKNRGMTESNWCRDYSNQLENIKEKILHIQNYINNLAKNIQTDFNEINTDYNRTEEVDNM